MTKIKVAWIEYVYGGLNICTGDILTKTLKNIVVVIRDDNQRAKYFHRTEDLTLYTEENLKRLEEIMTIDSEIKFLVDKKQDLNERLEKVKL